MKRYTSPFSKTLPLGAALAALALFGNHGIDAAAGASAHQQAAAPRTPVAAAVNSTDQQAFGHALPLAQVSEFTRMLDGKRVFSRTWLPDGASQPTHRGLGPLYNAASCADCHFRDGRGGKQQLPPPLIFRLFAPGHQDSGDAGSSPQATALPARWGQQLQTHGVATEPEGQVDISYEILHGRYADGTPYTLRRPRYTVAGYAPEAALQLGPRMPPTLVGIGLLAAVGEQTILNWADPGDQDGDGISGRPKLLGAGTAPRLGRFGWKAGQPGLAEQVAGALAEDMGVISPATQRANLAAEISRTDFARLLDYLALLAPPAQRKDHPLYARGKAVFDTLQCGGCHRPRLATVGTAVKASSADLPNAVFGLDIEPYTDLLLHDMGADLADGDGSTEAQREWRTAPLWGLGLMEKVNGQLLLLHDGRAGSFAEAILWHGGEAQASREQFRRLSKARRDALVAFLESV